MFQKPTFGNTSTSTFGSFNAGASPFGGFKPTAGTSAFGAPPAFGATATSQPATGGGLFGGSSTSGGLFGNSTAPAATPAFGNTSTGFGFGANPAPTGGLFGNNAGTSLFGNTQQTQQTFGAKPAGFGFGASPAPGPSTGGLFGSTQSSGGLFAPQNNSMTGGGLFSNNTTTAFGQTNTGTGHAKYGPVMGTDVVVKGGTSQNINIKHHCITCMKEYENKSLEELRLEDYQAGRKGAQAPAMFGFGGQPESKPLFGGSSAFGQPATTTSASVFGGSGIGTTGGFGQLNTFSFGNAAQPATNTSGLFGGAKPAFGTAPTTGSSLFGATTTTQAPSFGTNTSSFGFGGTTQNQSTGIFGAKPATTGFGTAPTTGFGTFGGGGGLFAPKTQAAPAFGTATPAFGGLSGGFGTSVAQAPGLFGNTFGKPAAAAPAFGFNSTPSLGGGLGGGLTQAKPAVGGFGTANTMTTFQTPQHTSLLPNVGGLGGGLFGNTSTMGAPSLGTGFNSNTSFNNNSLSGASATGNVHEQILSLAARPYGDSPLFKDLLPESASTAEDALRPTNPLAVKAVLEASRPPPPRSAPSLKPRALPTDKKSLFDGLEESDASLEDKLSLKPSRKRLVLRPNVKPNEYTEPEQNQGQRSLEEIRSEAPRDISSGTPAPGDGQQQSVDLPDSNSDVTAEKNNSWLSASKSPWNEKETSIYPNLDKELAAQASDRRSSWLTTKPLRKPLVSNPEISENSVRELGVRSPDISKLDKENIDSLSTVSEDEVPAPREMPPHPTGVVLTRPGYYTIPSLNQMISYMRPDGSCVVPHLTIGRYNYGNVFYDCEIDVAGMDLDSLVHFFNKEVIVYPEDSAKPPVNSGLNRRAVVTLERVWPRDKAQKRAITDPDRLMKMDYEGKLRRVCDKHDTKFIEYRPRTGSWVFRVEHFSKYGLTDSDEEDDAPTPEVLKRQLVNEALQKAAPLPPTSIATSVGLGGLGLPPSADDTMLSLHGELPLNGRSRVFEMDTTEDNADAPSLYQDHRAFGVKSPTSELARLENRQSHHVQLMKASLYGDTVMEDDISVSTGDQLVPLSVPIINVGLAPSLKTVEEDRSMDDTPLLAGEVIEQPMRPLFVQPHTMVLQYYRKVPPFKETIAGRLDAACLADMSICRARHSRVGFGPHNSMAFVATQAVEQLSNSAELCSLGDYVRGRSTDDWSMPVVMRLKITGTQQESFTSHLETLLKYSEVIHRGADLCPLVRVRSEAEARRELLLRHLKDASGQERNDVEWGVSSSYCLQVWKLCLALWGHDLENGGVPSIELPSMVERHRNLLSWLVEAVSDITDEELATPTEAEEQDEEDGHSRRVWTLMLGGRIKEACQVAMKHNDLNMCVLLAQASGDPTFRSLLSRQLSLWRECGADTLIAGHRWETLRLIAGQATPRGKLVQLDWMRALHATARYLCPQVPTLERVVQTYESLFPSRSEDEDMNNTKLESDEMGLQLPLPSHADPLDDTKYQVLDLRYELIKSRAHNTRPKLRPYAYTPDPLDYSLCFLLGTWFGNPSEESITGFADQLEASGLWHMAILTLAHHPDDIARGHLVRGVLSRHAPAKADTQELKSRLELLNKLGVPEKWLRIAQAQRAHYEHLPDIEAAHLVAAGSWNAAHKLLVEELLPEAVLADDMDSVSPLLEKLHEAAKRHEVSGWETGGLVLYHYTHICREIRGLVLSAENTEDVSVTARLEALRPRIAAACNGLAQLKPTSLRHRAARAEMGGRLLRLALGRPGASRSNLAPLALCSDTTLPLAQIITELAEQASESCIESTHSSPRSSHHKSSVLT